MAEVSTARSASNEASLRILTNTQVKSLMQSWTSEQIWSILEHLSRDLLMHSTSSEKPAPTQCPPRLRLDLDQNGSCLLVKPAMTAFSLATKILAPQNMSGTINLYDRKSGRPQAVLASRDLTSFRTALASVVLLKYRWADSTTRKNIVIYGAGNIAWWTVWLLTKLWPEQIAKVTIVNRSEFNLSGFELLPSVVLEKFIVPEPLKTEFFTRRDKDALSHADAIFCATGLRVGPSQEPPGWFGEQMLDIWREHGKAPYISLVGSYMKDMCEVSPLLIRELQRENPHSLVVDDIAGCVNGAGELSALLEPITSLGHVLSKYWDTRVPNPELNDKILVYKSVGIGIMDASVAGKVYDLAEKMHAGTVISEFD